MDIEKVDGILESLIDFASKPAAISDKTGVANIINAITGVSEAFHYQKREDERMAKKDE